MVREGDVPAGCGLLGDRGNKKHAFEHRQSEFDSPGMCPAAAAAAPL